MLLTDLPPATAVLAGALILPFTRGKARWGVALALPVLALVHAWVVIGADASSQLQFLGMTLTHVAVHGATPVFATIFCLMLLGGALFALNQDRRVELPAAFFYAGGALGVVFAGDMVTMFIFWELMTLGSTVVIWAGRQEGSERSGMRYFGLHAIGGVMLLMGIVAVTMQRIQAGDADPLAFTHFATMVEGWSSIGAHNVGMWLIMIGMLVNAGAPPFSPWIGDAYPEGSESGTAFLSAFTTKTAVFTLMIGFAGVDLLVWLGMFMAIYGVVYAVLENDMRRMLAYAIVTQVGVMLIGVGVGSALALDGAIAHAFSHIAYKGLLMTSAGSVLYMTGKRHLSSLGGLYRCMPITFWCALIGVLAMSGFPFTPGYGTKSLIVEAVTAHAAELSAAGAGTLHLTLAWWVLEGASAAIFLLVGGSFLWFVFGSREQQQVPRQDPPWNMRVAMIGFAAVCLVVGFAPGLLHDILPGKGEGFEVAYGFGHVAGFIGLSIMFGLTFVLLLPMLARRRSITLDFDWIWRRFVPRFWDEVILPMLQMLNNAQKMVFENLPNRTVDQSSLPDPIRNRLGSAWAVSVPVLMVTLMLLLYLVIYMTS